MSSPPQNRLLQRSYILFSYPFRWKSFKYEYQFKEFPDEEEDKVLHSISVLKIGKK